MKEGWKNRGGGGGGGGGGGEASGRAGFVGVDEIVGCTMGSQGQTCAEREAILLPLLLLLPPPPVGTERVEDGLQL
eukprot:23077-Hanusia_phi.AAC.4